MYVQHAMAPRLAPPPMGRTGRPRIVFDGVMDAARSGAWRVLINIVRALAALDRFRLSVILPRDRLADFAGSESHVDLVGVTTSPGHPIRNILWHALSLPGLAKELRADVLHLPSHNLLIARKVCPVVITVADITEFHLPHHYDPWRTAYRRLIVPRNARLADRIVTASSWFAADIRETLTVPASRIALVPHGVDPLFHAVEHDEAAARVRRRYRFDQPYILYVGQIHMPNKNLVRLVEAFAKVRRRGHPDLLLLLAGKEVVGGNDVRTSAYCVGVQEHVRFLGYVPDELLSDLYSGAEVFVFPSLYEGFGLPIVEAMRCGCPVVTSKTSAMAEIGDHAAILIDPYSTDEIASAIHDVLADARRREQLRAAGLERAKCYTWENTALKLAAVYEAVAGN